MPAKAGIQTCRARAGALDSRFRGNDTTLKDLILERRARPVARETMRRLTAPLLVATASVDKLAGQPGKGNDDRVRKSIRRHSRGVGERTIPRSLFRARDQDRTHCLYRPGHPGVGMARAGGTEWVALLAGAAAIQIEGEPSVRTLAPGDWLLIPAHARHRVEWTDSTGATIWLAIHVGV